MIDTGGVYHPRNPKASPLWRVLTLHYDQFEQDDAERFENTFSLEKMTYVEETDHVIYQAKMTHGRNRKNFEVYNAAAFIAAITQHIPQKSFQMVQYYGRYSNK